MNHSQLVSFIGDIANRIRGVYKRGKYQDVILPLVVLRRIDAVLEPTKDAVLAREAELSAMGVANRDAQLRRASGLAFYNTSPYTFRRLLEDPSALGQNPERPAPSACTSCYVSPSAPTGCAAKTQACGAGGR